MARHLASNFFELEELLHDGCGWTAHADRDLTAVDAPRSGTAAMTDIRQNEEHRASASHERGDGSGNEDRTAESARKRLSGFANRQKDAGLDRVSEFASAAHKAADAMGNQNSNMAGFVHEAASELDRLSSNLRGRDVSELYNSVHEFARRQPLAFFAGSFAAGVVLARFLKSSPPKDSERFHPSPNL